MIKKCLGYTRHICNKKIETGGTRLERCPECRTRHHLEVVKFFNRNHPHKESAKHYNKRYTDKAEEQIQPAVTVLTIRQLQNVPVEQWEKLKFISKQGA